MDRRKLLACLIGCGVLLAGCSGDSRTTAPGTDVSATEATAPATTEPPATTTSAPAPTTTAEVVEPVVCDDAEILAFADELVERARLAPGGEWTPARESDAFVERTNTAEEFAHRAGSFDCALRVSQTTDDGAQRLLVAAWIGDRVIYALQATDPPSEPYSTTINFQLMLEAVYGEWLRENFEWAGTMAGGETIVVGAVDGPVAVAAKAWPSAVERFEDLPVTIPVEQYAIDLLNEAGARNVSVGEPAGEGWQIAAIQFVTPEGLHLIATVATPDWFSAEAELFPGEVTVEEVGGVDVYVNRGDPDAYAVGSVGWECGGYVWFIDSIWGTVDELLDWSARLIETADCAG